MTLLFSIYGHVCFPLTFCLVIRNGDTVSFVISVYRDCHRSDQILNSFSHPIVLHFKHFKVASKPTQVEFHWKSEH